MRDEFSQMDPAEIRSLAVGEVPFRAILDAIPTRVYYVGADGRYRYVNQEYASFVGRPMADILGRTSAEVFGDTAWVQLGPLSERALSGETVRWEGWLTFHAGRRYTQRVYSPHRNHDGAIQGYFAFVRDITELKLHETELERRLEELRKSEAMKAAIINSALDCVVVIDEESRVIGFNPVAERTFGYAAAETVGRRIGELIVPPHLRAQHEAGLRRYLATGQGTVLGRRVEVEAMRADGSIFPVELAITEVKTESGRLFTAYLRDLTPAREAAAEIERQRDALHQSEKLAALGSLLAGVAHELNNPLSIVIGHALMLGEQVGNHADGTLAQIADRASKIQAAAERCGRIVRTFLSMARQGKAQRQEVRLPALIEGSVDLLGYGLRTDGIETRIEIPHDLPPLIADGDQLQQVLVNLIINAQQALQDTPLPRQIVVRASLDRAAQEVAITVTDNGPGVPAAVRGRIFDPFFTTKPTGIGTGVGLAVSRGIVESHGGRLSLLPINGPGATFEIRLPLAAGEATAPAALPADVPEERAATALRRALVVDDEAGIAAILSEILLRDGFNCDVADSGRAARALLEQQRDPAPYEVILCDLRMAEEDGPTFFRWLQRERPELVNHIAFVTGDTLGPAAGRFLAECGRPVVDKPFVPSAIRRLVSALADGDKAPSPPAGLSSPSNGGV